LKDFFMLKTKRFTFIAASLAVLLACSAVALPASAQTSAQPPAIKRQILQKSPLSADPGKEYVMATIEFAPGAATGRHSHHGDEFTLVTEGELVLLVDGQPERILKAGDSFHNPAGVVHEGQNRGAVPAKVLANWVVEKDQPLIVPAK
jgi:quercetin dioxygenase-like cupin family protein